MDIDLNGTYSQLSTTLTLLRMISGARYSGVPHNVHVLPFTLFAKPKSVTCTRKKMNYRYKQFKSDNASIESENDIEYVL